MKPQTKEWIHAARDDMIVIDEIIENDRITHIAAFHAQQCIEKSFKAVVEEFETGVIRTHHLMALYEKANEYIDIEVDEVLLDTLDKLYIDSRYPGEFGLLPDGKPTVEEAREFYQFAQDIHTRVSDMLDPPPTENE